MKRFLSAIAFTLMFLAIQAIAGMIVMAVYVLIKRDPQAQLPIEGTLITLLLFSLISMAVFILFKWFVPTQAYLRTRPWGVFLWSVIAALGALVPSLFLQELFTPVWPEWIQKLIDEANEQLALIMSVRGGYFIVALLAPVVEEMVFRGAVLRVLLRNDNNSTPASPSSTSKIVAVIVSALFFAFAHLNPAQMPHAFIIGILLGWLYLRTGSILPGGLLVFAFICVIKAAKNDFCIVTLPNNVQTIYRPQVAGNWTCSCGIVNYFNYCSACGKPRPMINTTWNCPKCGTLCTYNFCGNCGTPKQ